MLESRERSRCCSNNAANPIDDGMRYVSSLLLGVTALWTPAAIAEPPKAGHQRQGLVTVDIPTQPLSSALSTFAAQTGEVLVILTPPGMLAGKRAPALSATAPVDDLLRALLADTDVHFERTSANTVVLSAVPTGQTATHESEPSDFEAPRYLAPVVVSGSYYASLTSATLRERAASSLTEAIDATDIGSFPAQNAAEALLRVAEMRWFTERNLPCLTDLRICPRRGVVWGLRQTTPGPEARPPTRRACQAASKTFLAKVSQSAVSSNRGPFRPGWCLMPSAKSHKLSARMTRSRPIRKASAPWTAFLAGA